MGRVKIDAVAECAREEDEAPGEQRDVPRPSMRGHAPLAHEHRLATVVLEVLLQVWSGILKTRPDLVRELRAVFAPTPIPSAAPRTFLSVSEYARQIGYAKRTVENLIRLGLPISGSGRLRRVPVNEANRWLREGGSDNVLLRRARLDARLRASARVERTPSRDNE